MVHEQKTDPNCFESRTRNFETVPGKNTARETIARSKHVGRGTVLNGPTVTFRNVNRAPPERRDALAIITCGGLQQVLHFLDELLDLEVGVLQLLLVLVQVRAEPRAVVDARRELQRG